MDTLHQFLYGIHHGKLIDSDGTIFRRWLHDEWKLDVMRVIEASAITGGEVWRLNVVESKEFFCQRFVLRKIKRLRTRAGVHAAKKIEIGRDMHLFGVVTGVGLGEIEEHIGVALGQRGES